LALRLVRNFYRPVNFFFSCIGEMAYNFLCGWINNFAKRSSTFYPLTIDVVASRYSPNLSLYSCGHPPDFIPFFLYFEDVE
jgi:hypothetical protein